MSELTFYTHPMSRGRVVRWMLEEVGIPYTVETMDFGPDMKTPEYLAINPMGKVPAIDHDGKVVTEGAAICAYLADAFPDAGLAPTADERADYYRWLFFAAGPLESAITNRSMGFEVEPDKEKLAGYGNYDHVVDALDRKFQTDDYVCGNRFTMADVYVGAQLVWGTQFGTLPKRDSFIAYGERLIHRDAYESAKAVDDALIAENS